MPATARQYGVKNSLDPADNVQGAVKFLKWLDEFWRERVTNNSERLKFVLASYNCGAGHVRDAQRLTEKYGGNSQSWEDVSYWLLQESTQEYSTDAVVKFGFCRGLEPVNYVSHILERFDRYKQFLARRRASQSISQIEKLHRPNISVMLSDFVTLACTMKPSEPDLRTCASVSFAASF